MYNENMASKDKRLTKKQLDWVYHYVELGNGTEAAVRAGYKGTRTTLAAIGSENLQKPHILAKLDEIYSTWGMGARETLARIAKIARSFDPTDYITERERWDTDKKGKRFFMGYVQSVDLKALKKDGFSSLIKKVKQNSKGGMEVEYHDPVRALEMIAKSHALLSDKGHNINLNYDMSSMTNEQLERIAKGEDPINVIDNPS